MRIRYSLQFLETLLQEGGFPVGHISYRRVGGQRVPFRKEANGTWIPVPASANTAPSGESPPTAKPLVPNKEPPPETSPRKSSRPKTALSTRFGLLTELTSQRVFGKPMSVEDFEEAVSAPEGYQAQLESLERAEWKGHPALRMHIRVHDEDGNEAGEAIRYLYKNGKETHAHHFHIEIDSEHQRKGISNALLRSSFGFYQKHGVKQVNLQAALSGGRYAWARLGFSPDAEAENEVDDVNADEKWSDIRKDFLGFLKKYNVSDEAISDLKTRELSPYDMSRFTYENLRLGKGYMRSSRMPDWHAKMRLEDSDPGYKRIREVLGL